MQTTFMINLYQKANLKGKNLIEYKLQLQKKGFSQEQKDILVGTLLGDASMEFTKDHQNSNIKWEQNISNKAYINHIYEKFYEWVGIPPEIRDIKGGNALNRQSIWFKTYKHSSLNFFKHQFYKNKPIGLGENGTKQYKVVPKLIHNWLTPRALAYWYMDDGSFNNKGRDYHLHTQGFNLEHVEILCQTLNKNYNIKCNLHKDRGKYKLYILKQSNEIFKQTVRERTHPCFLYKIHSHSKGNPEETNK